MSSAYVVIMLTNWKITCLFEKGHVGGRGLMPNDIWNGKYYVNHWVIVDSKFCVM